MDNDVFEWALPWDLLASKKEKMGEGREGKKREENKSNFAFFLQLLILFSFSILNPSRKSIKRDFAKEARLFLSAVKVGLKAFVYN